MLDINKVEVKVSDETVQKATNWFKAIWYGAPKWLRVLLCVTLFIGGAYFLYNRFETADQVDELHEELKRINQRYQGVVFVDSYAYDVGNFVVVARAIDNQIQTIYEINQQILEFELEYITRNRPGDPSLVTVRRLMQQNKFTKESFDNVVQHDLNMYEEWLEKVKNNDTRSLNEIGRYHTSHKQMRESNK